jgi:indole-3-glycerol phosphate synthase
MLATMVAKKREEVDRLRSKFSLIELERSAAALPPTRDFRAALRQSNLAVIAEVKRASPSRGVLRAELDPVALAREYEAGGASALSILTDSEYFHGRKESIEEAKRVVHLPILRKDFIVDEYQVYESRILGADALLLIVKALEPEQLERLYRLTYAVGLEALVEVHTAEELEVARELGAAIIGVNNRDLDTFEVSLDRSLMLRPHIPAEAIAVSESGLKSRDDLDRLRQAGFDAVLIGEGLVTKANVTESLRELVRP